MRASLASRSKIPPQVLERGAEGGQLDGDRLEHRGKLYRLRGDAARRTGGSEPSDRVEEDDVLAGQRHVLHRSPGHVNEPAIELTSAGGQINQEA